MSWEAGVRVCVSTLTLVLGSVGVYDLFDLGVGEYVTWKSSVWVPWETLFNNVSTVTVSVNWGGGRAGKSELFDVSFGCDIKLELSVFSAADCSFLFERE